MPFKSANVPISTLNIKGDASLLVQILPQLTEMANLRVLEKRVPQKHQSRSISHQ
jgi:hypothetical protein